MKKILIALDYEDSARQIAEIGHGVAKAMNADVVLLHVIAETNYYSAPGYSPIMGYDSFSGLATLETDNTFEANRIAENFLNQSKAHLGDDSIQTIVRVGDYGENILSTASDLKVEMIVMGTHNRSGIEKIFTGSVAEKVLHHSKIPVLIIPNKSV